MLKSEEKSKHLTSSYCPISLLPVIGKTLEKFIINRINFYLHTNNLLSKKQFSLTPQNSTKTAINYIVKQAKEQIHKKQFLLIISLDIKGAFDNAWWTKILLQLEPKLCPKNLYDIMKSNLSERQAFIKFGGLIVCNNITHGCPQGSSLGPGLWNILFDDIQKSHKPKHVQITRSFQREQKSSGTSH